MKVIVHNGNVVKALKILHKKLKAEGFWEEHKRHRFFVPKKRR